MEIGSLIKQLREMNMGGGHFQQDEIDYLLNRLEACEQALTEATVGRWDASTEYIKEYVFGFDTSESNT